MTIEANPHLKTKVEEVLIYEADRPMLTLNKHELGLMYLSYLYRESESTETRLVIQISQLRLNELKSGLISLKKAYSDSEMRILYLIDYSLETGELLEMRTLFQREFDESIIEHEHLDDNT